MTEASAAVSPPPTPGGRAATSIGRQFKRDAVAANAIQTGGVIVRYFSQAALARWLKVDGYGQYTYALNVSQTIATPADAGFASSVIRFVPEYRATGDAAREAGIVRMARVAPVLVGLVLAGVCAVVAFVLGAGPTSVGVLTLALVATPLFALSNVQSALCRSYDRVVTALVPSELLQPALIVAGVAIAIAVAEVDVRAAVGITVLVIAIVVALQAGALARARGERAVARATRNDVKEWSGVSVPLMFATTAQLVFSRLDVVMVGLVLGAADAGCTRSRSARPP